MWGGAPRPLPAAPEASSLGPEQLGQRRRPSWVTCRGRADPLGLHLPSCLPLQRGREGSLSWDLLRGHVQQGSGPLGLPVTGASGAPGPDPTRSAAKRGGGWRRQQTCTRGGSLVAGLRSPVFVNTVRVASRFRGEGVPWQGGRGLLLSWGSRGERGGGSQVTGRRTRMARTGSEKMRAGRATGCGAGGCG